jgi:Legume lectin domain/Chitobiase/beta-hexosaminidase C-terminal domain/Bacterial lectin
MSVLKRCVTSKVLQPFFVIASFAVLLASPSMSAAQFESGPVATAAYNISTALPALDVTPAATAASTIAPVQPARASSLVAEPSTKKSATTSAQVINCSSGFAATGTCGVSYIGSGGQAFAVVGSPNGSTPAPSGSRVDLIPAGATHNAISLNYQTPVNVQAFTSTFTFVPNGWNIAFVLQNNTEGSGNGGGAIFSAGAGCEAGFYQAFVGTPPNNIIAVELDASSPIANANGAGYPGTFTYSSAWAFTAGQSPCNPNDNQPNYAFIQKVSTSPVPLNSPVNSAFSTTGDVYSATLAYDGSALTLSLFDVTAGGSCPGASCFTYTWPENIPSLVGGNTAYVGLTGGTNQASQYPLLVDSFVYSVPSSASASASIPTFSPAAGTYTTSQSVTISDSTPGATIYYTTDGATPTTSSSVYSGPITISSTETLQAIAAASGYSNSSVASATYTINDAAPAMPTFSVAAGTYTSTQTVSISDATSGATIHYTTNGTTPTTSSSVYSGPITVSSTETLEAVAAVGDPTTSGVAKATYVIQSKPGYPNYPAGFGGAGLDLNGATYSGTALQLTNGGPNEAASAFYATPLNIQSFTTDFTFQLTNAQADGFAFVIQNASPTALGATGGGLGYMGIPQSLAIKFDLYNNVGEGPDSTGLFTQGVAPTVPAVDLTSTPINLHSGDPFAAHITYDGTNLTLTLTDSNTLGTWSYSWPIDIPSTVGGNTAYVGFTGGTGGMTAKQTITSWTYSPVSSTPNYPAGFDGAGLDLNGATYSGNALQLTNGGPSEAASAFYAAPLNIQSFTTDFTFQLANAQADGFAFVIQNAGPSALGDMGEGLGFEGIPNSLAVKFDLYNNAGEGPNSTGLFTEGAVPTVPAVNLTGTPINLHSGDPFAAHITYDGTNLTLTLTDSSTQGTWSYSWPINIPSTVGGNTAYVGFTGGTGGLTSTQNVLSWFFSTP